MALTELDGLRLYLRGGADTRKLIGVSPAPQSDADTIQNDVLHQLNVMLKLGDGASKSEIVIATQNPRGGSERARLSRSPSMLELLQSINGRRKSCIYREWKHRTEAGIAEMGL
jgi:hypothetical protein